MAGLKLGLGLSPLGLTSGQGGGGPVSPPSLKLADNSSYLLLASGGHLLLANGA